MESKKRWFNCDHCRKWFLKFEVVGNGEDTYCVECYKEVKNG